MVRQRLPAVDATAAISCFPNAATRSACIHGIRIGRIDRDRLDTATDIGGSHKLPRWLIGHGGRTFALRGTEGVHLHASLMDRMGGNVSQAEFTLAPVPLGGAGKPGALVFGNGLHALQTV